MGCRRATKRHISAVTTAVVTREAAILAGGNGLGCGGPKVRSPPAPLLPGLGPGRGPGRGSLPPSCHRRRLVVTEKSIFSSFRNQAKFAPTGSSNVT